MTDEDTEHARPGDRPPVGDGSRRRVVVLVLALVALAGVVVVAIASDDASAPTQSADDPALEATSPAAEASEVSANSESTDAAPPGSEANGAGSTGTEGSAPDATIAPDGTPAEQIAACTTLAPDEIARLVGEGSDSNWTVAADFTPTFAERTAVPLTNGFYSEVIYLQGDIDGLSEEVFVFVTGSDDLATTDALFVGADELTREFFRWGSGIDLTGPAGEAIDAALASVDTPCLPR